MIIRSVPRLLLTLSTLAFIMSIGAVARPVMAQCETVTDQQLVATIYGKIKADKALAAQIPHINIVAVNAAVKFRGWANSKKDYNRIQGFALNTACVRVVNVEYFAEVPPATGNARMAEGCASGTKPCGDLCIPEADVCNISEFMGFRTTMFRFNRGPELLLLGMAIGCS